MRHSAAALVLLLACRPEVEPAPEEPTLDAGVLVFDKSRPTNVLMVSIDTLRRDHVGRYDPGESLTPFLDSLMEEGVVLDDFAQCSNWTFPSVTATLLGRTHVDNGFLPKFDVEVREPLPPGTPILASWLRDAGWRTYYESTNSWFGPDWGNIQGYQVDIDTGIFHTEGVLGESAARVASDDPERWFLHVHVKEPHAPYAPHKDFLGDLDDLEPIDFDLSEFAEHYESQQRYPSMSVDEQALLEAHLRVRYRGEVQWLDRQLSEAFANMDELGLLDDTLVVIWTDHGEAFWEHGHPAHAYTLHGEETDAIAFFWAKNLHRVAWKGPTTSIDLVPTILASLGESIPDEVTGDVVGTARPDRFRHALTLARLGPISSIERLGLKLIFRWDGAIRAYDRTTDPDELTDIYDPTDPDIAELWDALRPQVESAAEMAPELPVTWPDGR